VRESAVVLVVKILASPTDWSSEKEPRRSRRRRQPPARCPPARRMSEFAADSPADQHRVAEAGLPHRVYFMFRIVYALPFVFCIISLLTYLLTISKCSTNAKQMCSLLGFTSLRILFT